MPPRDLFGVAVRVVALWFLADAFYWGFIAFWNHTTVSETNLVMAKEVREGLERLICGAVLMIFADHIVKVVYGDANAANGLSTDATPDSEPPP
jgi:hypothetical protein